MKNSDRCQAETYAGDRCARRWVAAKRTENGHVHLCRQHAKEDWPSGVVPAVNETSERCPLCEVSDG